MPVAASCRPRAARPDVQQLTGRAAPHPEHRVHDRHVGDAEPVQQHRDGVHQHGRLVGDDLHRRTEAGGVVAGVELDKRLADVPALAQLRARRTGSADTSLPAADMSTGPVIAASAAGASPCGP